MRLFAFTTNLLLNQVPHELLVSNLQRYLAHILYLAVITNRTLHLTLVTPLGFIHLILTAPLGHSPPNPYSTIRNIYLIYVSSLGWDFRYKSSALLNREVTLRILLPQLKLPGSFDWFLLRTLPFHRRKHYFEFERYLGLFADFRQPASDTTCCAFSSQCPTLRCPISTIFTTLSPEAKRTWIWF